jgi:hypothetical protein
VSIRTVDGVTCRTRGPKLVVNDPMLRSPTVRQMSATVRSVLRSSAAARSSRRVRRYWCGVSPKERRNSRLKCAGGEPRSACECRHVERLAVAGVDQVLGTHEVARWRDRLHRLGIAAARRVTLAR